MELKSLRRAESASFTPEQQVKHFDGCFSHLRPLEESGNKRAQVQPPPLPNPGPTCAVCRLSTRLAELQALNMLRTKSKLYPEAVKRDFNDFEAVLHPLFRRGVSFSEGTGGVKAAAHLQRVIPGASLALWYMAHTICGGQHGPTLTG